MHMAHTCKQGTHTDEKEYDNIFKQDHAHSTLSSPITWCITCHTIHTYNFCHL